MNFEGWEVEIEFLDDATDCYPDHSPQFFSDWKDELIDSIKPLVFECDYMPRRGDFIDVQTKDGLYISEVSFFSASKRICFWMTYRNYLEQFNEK